MLNPFRFIFNSEGIKPRHREIYLLIKERGARLLFAMGASLLVAAATAITAWLVRPAVDYVFFQKDYSMLPLISFAVVVIFFVKGIGMYGQEYFMNYVGESIIRQLRDGLYDRIQDLPLQFFHREKTGALMSRITYDVYVVKAMVSTTVTGFVRDFFTIIGLLFVVFYMEWKLALISIVVLPLAYFPVIFFGRRVRRISTQCQETMAELNSFLHETFAGNKIVKAFGMEKYEKNRFFEKTGNYFRLEIKAVIARSMASPVMETLAGVGAALVIYYGGTKVFHGTSTPGTFFSFLAAVFMLYDPVKKLSHLNNALQQGMAAMDRIYDVLETKSEIQESQNPVTIPDGAHQVVFENVDFKYEEALVLDSVNLEVAAGEVLALVGMSGGGKTSLVNLIPRFYDVAAGRILIDDIDIRDASIRSLRRQIGLVTQEPILFNDTVRNNIAYGNPEATEEEIVRVAKAAYAYDFIQGFPKGFDTMIGELGSRLSGGEKQRICIARALLKDAPILILDEATSSLDTEAEQTVQKALENLMKGRTTFVIAHRLSTIAHADRIIVLVKGNIVEEGRHEALMAKKGEYYKLHQMQFEVNSPPSHPAPGA